jgi:cellobiose phosphorylase
MDSVYNKLNSEYGIKLCDPPYTKFPHDIGSVIHYPGGIKENAGIFCHANTWAIIAETILKRADRAMQYYKQILPPLVSSKIGHDKYRVEPYVYCQFITGPDHPNHGSASHSWLTGTSVWSFVALSQYILGIKSTFYGLKIDPCIPKDWKEYEVTKKYRGALYKITVKNPNGQTHGVKRLVLNGKELDSTIIPPQAKGTTNIIEVELGSGTVLTAQKTKTAAFA